MEQSRISWTDNTFNPWVGCAKVSPGCARCYAETLNKRCGGENWGAGAPRETTGPTYWRKPSKWERQATASGVRIKVFSGSMCDIFDDEAPLEARTTLFELARVTPHLDWQLLTKRPGNFSRFLPEDWGCGYDNVWLGCTIEDRRRAEERIPILRATPALIRFLSCEPLLEDLGDLDLSGVHWVIVGGESGGKARPFDVEWAQSVQHQCVDQGVAFFSKQLGANPLCGGRPITIRSESGRRDTHAGEFDSWPDELAPLMVRQFPTSHTGPFRD